MRYERRPSVCERGHFHYGYALGGPCLCRGCGGHLRRLEPEAEAAFYLADSGDGALEWQAGYAAARQVQRLIESGEWEEEPDYKVLGR